MSELLQIPYTVDDRKWYFFSIFYAREKWAELIIEIMNYYRIRQGQFCSYLFSFSVENGENIQIALASSDEKNDYTSDIQAYFQVFLEQCPSTYMTKFPYGKVIWGNYPNNSIVWNRFRIPNYTNQ